MKTTLPLSKSQYGIYAECVQHQGEACYNLPYIHVLDGSLDGERLRRAIEAAVKAHPTLFTRIILSDEGEPMQTVTVDDGFSVIIEEIDDIEAVKPTLVVPFDIYGDRLFRIRLLKDREHYYYFADFHHIIADGTTLQVMLQDVDAAYRGQTLVPEQMTMAEMVQAEVELRQSSAFEEAKQWYAQHFDCGDTFTPLMPDLEIQQHSEASLLRSLSVSLDAVEAFCKQNAIFRSTLFTAAYSFLLAKYNNEQESLFTTVYNGRTDKRFAHSVGMVVQTLPVYAKFDDSTTVLDFLRNSQEQMSGCRQHRAYAYSDMVTDLGLQTNSMFAWHGTLFSDDQLCGKPMKTVRIGNSTLAASLYLKAFILGGHYQVKAEYNSNEYSEALIAQFLESYEAVVEGFLRQQYLRDVDITTASQVAVLDSFNQNDVDYDDTQTIVSLFHQQAQATPHNIAVVFKDKHYTYQEVDEMSDRLAAYVSQIVNCPSSNGNTPVVSVLIPRCEWMAIASLGVLKAGCAYQPLDPTYPKERLNFMMQDADAKLLISLAPEEDGDWLDGLDVLQEKDIPVFDLHDFNTLPEVTTPLPVKEGQGGGSSPLSSWRGGGGEAGLGDSLFILLYTSGSTGVPKGCQLTHGNLVCFCHWYQRFYGLTPDHRVAAYASYGFDACMMDMYPALTCGAAVHIVPEELRLDLMALNDYFEQNQITHSFMTTQVGYQFAANIDNHSLLHLSTGGEKLASLTPPRGYAFYNGYGPTECTIFTTVYRVTEKMKEIPIGKPLDNMRLYVVDSHGHRLPVGAAGELWVSGPQVSRGYLNRPEKTAEVFISNPFIDDLRIDDSRLNTDGAAPIENRKSVNCKYQRVYRTGDIVRYLPSGDIQFVGRRDGQVKIRGFRIELKEVEAIIREFPGIKDATVQAFDEEGGAGGKFIAAYVVSDQPVDIEALNSFILDEKPPYMVPAVTMQIDAIPLNQNQKVNKRALPKPVKQVAVPQQQTEHVPLNVLEQELHEMIAAIVNNDDFGITTLLGYAGLTSISAIKLAIQVNKRYGVALDSKVLVKSGTLQMIENEIWKGLSPNPSPKERGGLNTPAEQGKNTTDDQGNHTPLLGRGAGGEAFGGETFGGEAPLSYAQQGVYFECLKNPTSTIYNIPYLLSYPEGIGAQQLADVVKQVVEEHPELSVHFTTKDNEIVQTLEGSVPVEMPVTEMTDEALTTYKNEFVRPFNLQKAPLYRFEVVKTERGVHLLMDIHHLLFDGGSADLFIREINSVLDGSAVEKERYTYFDFVADQQRAEESDAFRASQQFFAEKLQTCEGASEIPADLQNTDVQGFIGEAVCPVDFDSLTSKLSALRSTGGGASPAKASQRSSFITSAHLFLAATAYVVSRYTNNRDVYLCTVSSGRSNLKIADTVGMFVNTLALGLSIDDVSVGEFLQQVSDTFDETLSHEDYPFARIATDYGFRPAIAYAYQVGVLSSYSVGGQPIGQELLELNVPKFPINIKIESRGVVVQYDDSRYSARLGSALAESIVAVVECMVTQPDAKVRQLSIVSQSQEEELSRLRQTAIAPLSSPEGDTHVLQGHEAPSGAVGGPFRFFHDCISHYAQTQPDHEALVAIDGTFTYREMDEASNRIANGLRERGVKPGDRVALLLPRTSRLILSLFGVLKAGAAYIPCDPDYPADRVKLILEDSEARYIIGPGLTPTPSPIGEGSKAEGSGYSIPTEKWLDVEELLATEISTPLSIWRGVGGEASLAYLIYTSGSTGRPKGVMLHHAGICNYLYGHPANVFAHAVLTDADRVLSVTTISFDAALQDIGMAFYNGKTLIVATEEQANNPIELTRLIEEQHINMVSGTPSRWQTWLTSPDFCRAIAQVRICRAGGEKFSDALLQQMRSVTKARIFNCYGPTEITVASNNAELTHADQVTVGKPQLNVKEFIVDSDGNELPVGVVGELYIGGRGVAHGYNNLDQMTRERFIDYAPRVSGGFAAETIRVYKSGDYAKWLPDGRVVILGRTDHQIKLRGLRIELGEIENVMLSVPGMKKVVIMIRKLNDKEHLCAYYTADREIAPDALKAEISKRLTQYMVPTAYLQLDAMPMTPNGKTDVKALPEPQLAVSSAYVAPVNDTERAFCDIFATILQMDKVGATDNFFELGGTSLVVTRVIIEADKAGLHVAYGDVFANPTPRQLAALITGTAVPDDSPSGTDAVADFDYTAIDNLLRQNTLDVFRKGQRRRLGHVLLTGATGYLGIHILHELISLTPGPSPTGEGSKGEGSDCCVRSITCLVRAKDKEKAKRRLQTMLFYYFADKFEPLFVDGRLNVVAGDVTDDLVALMETQPTPLLVKEGPVGGSSPLSSWRGVGGEAGATGTATTVFNCAAIVKHFSEGTEIEDVNIGGAQRCVDFCLKTGAALVHISTASTRGLWVEGSGDTGATGHEVFTEQRLYMGQYLGNKYIYSKFMAERLILDAVAHHGLSAKIMRVGNLAARSTDGEFQANFSTNSFMGRIKVYNMLGCCPYGMRNKRVEFSPINEVSRAIVLLATTPKECTVFHPYNIHSQFLGDVLMGLASVTGGIRFVEQEEFAEAMDQAKDDPQKARQMASLLAYQDMAHGQKTTDVSRDNDYTTQVLYRLGFAWSATSWDYVERMLTAIGGFGFFE